MKHNRFWLDMILGIAILLVSLFFTAKISNALSLYVGEKEAIAKTLDFQERLMNTDEWLPFSDAADEKIALYEKLQASAETYYQNSINNGILFSSFVLIYLLIIFGLHWRKRSFNRSFGMALIISSLCLLYIGLQAPFGEIEAFNENLALKIPVDLGFYEHTFEKSFDGKISYFYQNKSIFQVVYLLFAGGNIVLGIALVLFSIVFPLFKLLASCFVLIFPKHRFAKALTFVVIRIGKWSMADVFVAGTLLAYFSYANINPGVETSSKTLIGLYFFLAFVLLSISSGYFVKKAINHSN